MSGSVRQTNRIEWVDSLKAFAIILVVLGHTGLEGQSSVISTIHSWIYLFHMPLFFLLSGISFTFVYSRGCKTVFRQILNIALIYVIQSVVYILFNLSVHAFLPVQTQVEANLSNLYTLFISPIAHFWYLYALVINYLIEVFLHFFIKDGRTKMIIVVALTFIGRNTAWGILSQAIGELLFFECGIQIVNAKKIPLWVSGIGLISSLFISFVTIGNQFLAQVITITIALLVSLFFVSLFSGSLNSHFGKYTELGRSSLWIYIFHTYFTSITRNICNRILPSVPVVSLLVVTIVGIIGPLFVMFIFNKLKISWIVARPISLGRKY